MASEFRTIKPTSIRIGDLIRVTATDAGVKRSRTGRVSKRNHWDGNTEWSTKEGGVLLTIYKDGTTDMMGRPEIKLIKEKDLDVLPGMAY